MFESIEIINFSSMLHRCRIVVSLMNRLAFLMTTLMNHQCYQCVLDWGMTPSKNDFFFKKNKTLSRNEATSSIDDGSEEMEGAEAGVETVLFLFFILIGLIFALCYTTTHFDYGICSLVGT